MGNNKKRKNVLDQVGGALTDTVADVGKGADEILKGGDRGKKAIENLGRNVLYGTSPQSGLTVDYATGTGVGGDIKETATSTAKNITGETAKEIAADQAAEAKRQEAARIKAEQERESQKRKSTAYGLARNRQKSIMGEGRGGTILTSPLGTASGAINSGKTLLGQ